MADVQEKSKMLRMLHLEDSENDQVLVAEMLRADGLQCDVIVVKTENDFESSLKKNPFDVILSDFSLPSCDALKALEIAQQVAPQIPFIFFSGTIGEEVAVETLKHGATDYILKQRPKRLPAAIRNALRSAEERDRIRRMEIEMRQLQEQFLRAQRLESLGALVGGIAHDLNNMLVPIIVGVDILKDQKLSDDGQSMVQTMESSARRSAEMVRQMLLFARGGEANKTLVHLASLIKEMCRIISDTFPKNIQCEVQVDKNSWPVLGVPTQLHQVLLNLCVNARDAMPKGGTLVLKIKNAKVDAAEALRHMVEAGEYLCVSVADTGEGIPPELLGKIFQPFFTTKGPEKGTGLGLSTSRSIVKSHGGFISITSKVGVGTEFKVYLPASDGKSESGAEQKNNLPAGNGELILVVDDEESILAITRAALQNFGYEVLIAGSGIEAISIFSKNAAAIKLVVSDLAMPLMDGRVTMEELRKIKPDVKVIISSGSEKELEEALPQMKINAFILKPFTNEKLLETVHEVLSGKIIS
jgi:two-component system, cell cycle sensor histidine kinase and response regulator CckA